MTDLALPGDSHLRRTGIRLLGEIPWGTHVCVFYETREDLLDTATAYFKVGLDSLGGLVPHHRGRRVDRITR
jgi:hypothetical protein